MYSRECPKCGHELYGDNCTVCELRAKAWSNLALGIVIGVLITIAWQFHRPWVIRFSKLPPYIGAKIRLGENEFVCFNEEELHR